LTISTESTTAAAAGSAAASATPHDREASSFRRLVRGVFGDCLRDRRFWLVQVVVLVIAALHVGLEVAGTLLGLPPLYLLPVSLFFIPTMYASSAFGRRGGVLTVLWCWALSAPTLIVTHSNAERVGVDVQLAIMLALAILVGGKVDAERRALAITALANTRLRELNAAAVAASGSLDLARVFRDTLAEIVRFPSIHRACVIFAPNGWPPKSVLALREDGPADGVPPGVLAAAQGVIESGTAWTTAAHQQDSPPDDVDEARVLVPLRATGGTVGALGVAGTEDALARHSLEQFDAIARQLGLAVDNVRHLEEAQRALSAAAASRAALRTYMRKASEAQEDERKRWARELHDETLQTLVIVRNDLKADGGKHAEALAEDTIATLDGAIAELRRLCRNLRPSVLDDLGLVRAVEALASELGERSGVEIRVTCAGEVRRLEAPQELLLYRIVQEALRNVELHSGAALAEVSLVFSEAAVDLVVSDDGHGFDDSGDPLELTAAGHLGLQGMRERAGFLGGELLLQSRPGAGTRIAVRAAR
jgi:signal transduction histidine kinase